MATPILTRSRIILVAMVPFAILAIVGMGLTAVMAYKVLCWDRAEASYVGIVPGIFVRGNVADHAITKRHFRFAKKDGSPVQLYFLERQTSAPTDKSMDILYDPSVVGEITDSEGSRWDRAASVHILLCVGLGMAAIGLLPCLIGGVLLFRTKKSSREPT